MMVAPFHTNRYFYQSSIPSNETDGWYAILRDGVTGPHATREIAEQSVENLIVMYLAAEDTGGRLPENWDWAIQS